MESDYPIWWKAIQIRLPKLPFLAFLNLPGAGDQSRSAEFVLLSTGNLPITLLLSQHPGHIRAS